jgi:putative ABC transport system ATP-binding protein
MTESAVSVEGLHKTYGKKQTKFEALRGVDLDIKKGESVAIVGKSGSGKSTLMHILALLDQPTKGRILVGGVDATGLSNRKLNKLRNKEFGFVFQQFFMNSRNTVLNNVMLPLDIAGVSSQIARKQAMRALETVELDDKAKNKANDLSGGQKQRVCIARALVNNPKVIFADEPTGNLDSATGRKIEDILMKLNKKTGITLIVVTHDSDLAKRCDRQIYIKDGQIVKGDEK